MAFELIFEKVPRLTCWTQACKHYPLRRLKKSTRYAFKPSDYEHYKYASTVHMLSLFSVASFLFFLTMGMFVCVCFLHFCAILKLNKRRRVNPKKKKRRSKKRKKKRLAVCYFVVRFSPHCRVRKVKSLLFWNFVVLPWDCRRVLDTQRVGEL